MGNKKSKWSVYIGMFNALNFKKDTTRGIIWSRGIVFGCLSAIITIVFRLITVCVDVSIVHYLMLNLVLFTFIYFSFRYYIQVKNAELNILKFFYMAFYIVIIAIVINILVDYLFFHVLDKRIRFIDYKKDELFREYSDQSSVSINNKLNDYIGEMELVNGLSRWFQVFFSGAIISVLVSYKLFKSNINRHIFEQREEIKNKTNLDDSSKEIIYKKASRARHPSQLKRLRRIKKKK